MEPRANDENVIIRRFMEVTGVPADATRQFLQATSWHLEEAIQLYFAGSADNVALSTRPSTSMLSPTTSLGALPVVQTESCLLEPVGDNNVRPPLPIKSEVLYEDFFQYRVHRIPQTPNHPSSIDAFRNFDDEANERDAAWGTIETSNSSSSAVGGMRDSLAALYRPPFVLLFQGTFEQAKAEAERQGKWLLVNVQSTKEFSSYTLNRDTWAHEAVKETISISFVFWQVYEDSEEGRKVCTYYKLMAMPTTLVLDPLTGQKMRAWEGMVAPDRFLEDLVPYLDRGPLERHPPAISQKRPRESTQLVVKASKEDTSGDEDFRQALAASLEGDAIFVSDLKDSDRKSQVERTALDLVGLNKPRATECKKLPNLPEEPAVTNSASCRVAVRFPDGRRAQRRFLQSDPIQYLWAFSCSLLPEAANGRTFRLTQAIPGATPLDFFSKSTIKECGLGNSMLAMTWD